VGAFRIHPEITRVALARSLPPSLNVIPGEGTERVVAIVFRADKRRVVRLRQVEKALARAHLGDGPLVVVGGCFSVEAIARLRELGAEVHAAHDHVWSEPAIDQVKRPRNEVDRFDPNRLHDAEEP